MEPVAKRTRRRVEEKLLSDYRERRKSVPVNNSPAASASRTVIIIDEDEEEEESANSGNCADHTAGDPVVVKEEEILDAADSPLIVTLSSCTESDEFATEEESSESEEDWKLGSRSVKSQSAKSPDREKKQGLIVLNDDDDDTDDAQSSRKHIEYEEEEEKNSESEEDWKLKSRSVKSESGKTPDRETEQGLIVLDDDDIDDVVAGSQTDIEGSVYDAQSSRKRIYDNDDEEEDERETWRGAKKRANRRRPLTEVEIHRVLFNSIMEVDNSGVRESVSPHKTDETTSSDADSAVDMEIETPKEEDELDSLYKQLDFCLVYSDSDKTDARLDNDDKDQDQCCKQGEHYLILDEEIGIVCKSCGLVREEIKHVMPPFHDNPFGESDRRRYSGYNHQDDDGDLPHLVDPNCEYQQCKEDASFDPTGTVWEILPDIRGTLLPHQREAFEFIWRNVAGGTRLDELTSNGGGCLISHAPGTGKTRLAIAFMETYMKKYSNSRPVIVAPASILLTWKKEFDKWKVGVPFQNLNDEELSKEEMDMARSLGIASNKKLEPTAKRLIKLLFWRKHESVLAISYTLLTQLAGGEGVKKRGRAKIHHRPSTSQCRDETQMFRKMLLDLPDLMILDEGHVPRNERTSLYKVLSDVRTKKRVLLSGTPFQNNFRELYNIFCLVRPEFSEIWEKNPFRSTVDEADGGKIRELKAKTEPFFHRYDGSIVDATVPGLNDNIVFLEASETQKKLLQDVEGMRNHLEADVCTALISVHPRLLDCKDRNPDFTQELKRGKWDLAEGAKAKFLIRLIQLSSALEERVLVFSEFIHPLNFIKAVLESSDYFGWREGREILLMSGSKDMKSRKRSMDLFNKKKSEAKVMLASIKACSEGIELTGASRVVLLDVVWNPAVERQAMCRAYRIGQGRVVHVYHLIMTDHDSNRHITQTQKNKCSKYVFSSRSGRNDTPGSSKPRSEDLILERLLEENIVKEAVPWKACEPGLDTAS